MQPTFSTAANTPIDISIRHMGFQFAGVPRYWASDDPFETHLLSALSLTFPQGEQAFIDSVRAFSERITDPALKEDVRAFIGQEMQHSREHAALNDFIESQGLPVRYVYEFIAARIKETQSETPPLVALAVTCALEHFTAIMAKAMLEDPRFMEGLDERVRPLWIWHAIEEMEHKSVAFDVYRHVGGTYRMRALTMLLVTREFIGNQAHFHRKLMVADGQLGNVRSWARGIRKFWGPKGLFTRLIPAYLEYFKPSFHPWQRDDRALVEEWRRYVEERAKRVIPQSAAKPTA
jgi:uncharacterized protein